MDTEVAIVGAGPYGLSVAAHLHVRNVPTHIFGRPLLTWREHMPAEMLLKSDGFASSLDSPVSNWRLADYCAREGIEYGDREPRVALATFADYGVAFQRALVPDLDQRDVARISRTSGGYALTLEDGDSITASRVVVAAGITHFAHVPERLERLGSALTHSSAHRNFEEFAGRTVGVIGGGSSAVEVAAALLDVGARVHILARRAQIHFWNAPPPSQRRSMAQRLRSPISGLGPGWRQKFCEDLPDVFRLLPSDFRLDVVKRFLGPSAGWWLTEKVTAGAVISTDTRVVTASVDGDGVLLEVEHEGAVSSLHVDHVIAATGYRADLDRLSFLSDDIRSETKRVGAMPALSSSFESSVPGVHYVGAAAAGTFGPLMRFMVGAEFAAPRLARSLSRATRRASSGATRNRLGVANGIDKATP